MNNSSNSIDQELLVRFLAKEADESERLAVEQWINLNEANKKYFSDMLLIWEASSTSSDLNMIDAKEDWKKVQEKIVKMQPSSTPLFSNKNRTLLYQFTRVAAIILFCAGLYFTYQIVIHPSPIMVRTETALEQSQLTLPDGSIVYLNKNSTLTYPQIFDPEKREVILEGEAFFDVVKSPKQPFLIRSKQTVTEVVGTSFNVDSHDADEVIVTVVTGRVNLSVDNSKIDINPGEQGAYMEGTGLQKILNPDTNFLSWKTGILVFQNTPVKEVVKTLSKHYGKNILIQSGDLTGCTLTSTFKQQSLEEVLTEMQLVFSLEVDYRNESIILTGKVCQSTE